MYHLDFFEGNILKYLLRRKGDRREDIEKIRHYAEKYIEVLEKRANDELAGNPVMAHVLGLNRFNDFFGKYLTEIGRKLMNELDELRKNKNKNEEGN